ncbi:hypothetical protein YQE_07704, partial [Dendroctonus ponderosae]
MAKQEAWPNRSPVLPPEQWKLFAKIPAKTHDSKVSVSEIVENSAHFPIEFPIKTVKCEYLRTKGIPIATLANNANSAYPILHETALPLFLHFLQHKKRFGSQVERKFYKNFTVEELIDRLLRKRAVVFYGRSDTFMLMDNMGSVGQWEVIGTSQERAPRTLENCLSYDEIKLAALLSVSSFSCFINNGARDNIGRYSLNEDSVEPTGVIIGLIGPRFEKPLVMEHRDIIISREQNTHERGYGRFFAPTLQGLFLNFYGEPCLSYDELSNQLDDTKKYKKLSSDKYFNNYAYEKRLSLSFDTLLVEANQRAKEVNKMAFVHVVGIGLGVWRASRHQDAVFMKSFSQRIRFLSSTLTNIANICFSYINHPCGKYADKQRVDIPNHPLGGIKIHIENRNPHDRLAGDDAGKLLVVSYAWDGNALPGNEFWLGQLAASGDPAAAASTQIAELHNAHINPNVSAANLRIATLNGVGTFHDYIRRAASPE